MKQHKIQILQFIISLENDKKLKSDESITIDAILEREKPKTVTVTTGVQT